MKAQKIIILGAASAIAADTARMYAERGAEFFLAGRSAERLDSIANDLRARGAQEVHSFALDLADLSRHQEVMDQARAKLGKPDCMLIAFGTLPDQKSCQENFELAEREIRNNFLAPLSFAERAAALFEASGGGTICVISSVAGDRGRQSNYIYGSAKGGLSLALQGLRNRLSSKGVHVVTVKPGFVDTPMTRDFKKGPLFAGPRRIASGIVKAIDANSNVVYLPWFWRPIMWIIKAVPEFIFKRMKL